MWIVWLALAFFAGIISGSITMAAFNAHVEARTVRLAILDMLYWIDGARKAGTLDRVLPETLKKWEDADYGTDRGTGK